MASCAAGTAMVMSWGPRQIAGPTASVRAAASEQGVGVSTWLGSCRIEDGDVSGLGRFRYRLPGLAKQNEVLSHRFQHELLGLGTRVSRRHDTRQIW